MLQYPNIDPVAISIGPLSIHWYGLMYLLGFGLAYVLMNYRAKQANSGWNKEQVSDLIFYSAMGVVLGGRAGYVLFYNFGKFVDDPLWLFAVWEGGMSFHGGLLGVIAACILFARKYGKSFYAVTDFGAPMVPIGLFFGRIGNFIGGELWGRVSDAPWAMVFPKGGPLPRHPSQLYEAFLEGLVLFLILWIYSRKPRPTMAVSGLFLVGYGVFRFAVEFVRQPDSHIGMDLFGWMTRGQILCVPMVLFGLAIIYLAYKRQSQQA
ncbi:prolipoprotein diacylglyceryl transferase [Bermanella marisrubri]|uniref:Phosphatidylglycerol--prolipoprotein diacylglyceryl transferase n=1 Tax=Bermanella marisrubri TaxID=207949 RepID=Q1MYJ1_9GAMM|nr:prolipoprotein diacylglyceryl transferase [Bermanella marisrubri]EAT11040.1 prolipoprotein diacylglyceryl transferase [Oceanobacter sp. RED65] [Bermanella marisrubri]QIZ82974.1 prolipoprotein diacylglyceryl transferase [Bermanella marisrubri]